MTESSDEALAAAAANKNDAAFEELYTRHASALMAFLNTRAMASVDAEDVASQTWMRVLNGLRDGRYKFDQPGQFRRFLLTVARNTMLDSFRRKLAPELSSSDVAGVVIESEAGNQLEHEEELKQIEGLIEALPDRDRHLIRMRIGGLSYDEISERLGLPLTSVRARFRRVLSVLRKQFETEAPAPVGAAPKREITVTIDPGDAPPELIADLYASLASLYRACGGSGLTIGKDERRVFVRELL